MSGTEDYFEDILAEDGGSLASQGLTDFDNVKQKVKADGLEVRVHCRFCGKPTDVTLEWDELAIIGMNGPGLSPILPNASYKFSPNNGSIYVQLPCPRPNCGQPGVAVHVTPDEADRHVKTAAQRGFVNPQRIAALAQQVRMQRGG